MLPHRRKSLGFKHVLHIARSCACRVFGGVPERKYDAKRECSCALASWQACPFNRLRAFILNLNIATVKSNFSSTEFIRLLLSDCFLQRDELSLYSFLFFSKAVLNSTRRSFSSLLSHSILSNLFHRSFAFYLRYPFASR